MIKGEGCNLKAVLFDMDGVLLDSETAAFELLRKTLDRMGITVSLKALMEQYTGMNSNAIYRSLIEKWELGMPVERFRARHYQFSGNYYKDGDLIPMPGLTEYLEFLHIHKISMAVVSSTESRNVLYALNRLCILKYFHAVVSGDMVNETKPSPEGYLKAAGCLDAAPADCLAIEDSPIGIQAARNAGISVVGYKGSCHEQDTSKADVQASNYYDLLEMTSSILHI